jgi:hypothetical protein
MARSDPARQNVDVRADDDVADAMEVPAAVVCAVCGRCECPGCTDERITHSGVVAIVPWERPGDAWFSRFFATVQATTQGAETFFSALPDGSVLPALSFALLAELLAVGSMGALIIPVVLAVLPGLAHALVEHPETRQIVAIAATLGIVGLATLMVGTHALHGALLSKQARRRAVRAGLYACGWDLGASPAGVAIAMLAGGMRSAMLLSVASVTAPRRGVDAALDGIFHVRGLAAHRIRNRAVWLAMAACVGALPVLIGLVAAAALVVR